MSSAQAPLENVPIYNAADFTYTSYQQSIGANKANFPVLQGHITIANGAQWPDNTNQLSAYTGAGAFGSIGGTTYLAADVTLDEHGRITNITNGGGGGGIVTNPMSADLDGNGYSIFNVDTFTGMDLTITGLGSIAELQTEEINDSAAVIYRNKGAVVAGNYYNVGEGLQMIDAEASCIVVSRCLDPGFKQTMVIHVSMFNAKAHLNLISNALESDTPIFTLVSAGDDGLGSGGFSFFCNQNSATWEYRVYRQQDNKGTGTYPANSFFNFAVGGAVPTSSWTITYTELDTSVHASAAVSGSFLAKTSLTSASLLTDTAVANVSLSTARVNTDELNNNGGTGLIDVLSPIRMNNNDIQSAGVIGANAYYTGGPAILPLGAPGGPLYLDTVNNRVGINVSVPTEDLEIDGNIQLDSAGANKIKFYDATATVERAEIDAAASGATGGKLVFYTKEDPGAITARMTIEEDGRIQVTNRIENLVNPVNAQDAATKDYVDSSIGTGFVTNPMSADLDGGQFNVTNIDRLTVQNATGSTFDADAATNIVNILDATNTSAVEVDANGYSLRVKDNTGTIQCSLLGNTGNATHSGNCVDQLGGINAQPKLTGGFPRAGNNLIMGKYGWNDSGPSPANFALGRANDTGYYGGGGNIYCNAVRENIWYNQATSSAAYVFPYTAGFQGNSVLRQYYNGADIKNVLMNPGNAGGQYQEFQLPPITEAMLGMSIKVTRLRLNETFYPGLNAAGIPRYKAAVVVSPAGTDYIAGPDSIFVSGGGLVTGGLAIDPYGVITTLTTPSPYTGLNSITLVATQCGDGQNVNAPNPEYIWHCTNEVQTDAPAITVVQAPGATIPSGTNTTPTFSVEIIDTNNWITIPAAAVFPNISGIYLITANVVGINSNNRALINVTRSGSVIASQDCGPDHFDISVSVHAQVNVGQNISMVIYQNDGSTQTCDVTLGVQLIRAT